MVKKMLSTLMIIIALVWTVNGNAFAAGASHENMAEVKQINCESVSGISSCIYLGPFQLNDDLLKSMLTYFEERCDSLRYAVCVSHIYSPKYSPLDASRFQGSAWQLTTNEDRDTVLQVYNEMQKYFLDRTDTFVRITVSRSFSWATAYDRKRSSSTRLFVSRDPLLAKKAQRCPFDFYAPLPGTRRLASGQEKPGVRHLFIVRESVSRITTSFAETVTACVQQLASGEDVFVLVADVSTNVFYSPVPLLIPEFIGAPKVIGDHNYPEFVCLRDQDLATCQMAPHFSVRKLPSQKSLTRP